MYRKFKSIKAVKRIIAVFFILSVSAFSEEDKKIGLVLSGGSAKGIAHIGILKVLEEEKVPVEYITGASMGSIVGGLYSIGYTAAELEEIALELDWIGLFTDNIPRKDKGAVRNYFEDRNTITLPFENFQVRFPSGVVGGKNISSNLNNLFFGIEDVNDFKKFPQKFALVATDLENGEAVMLDKGSLPTAIRASMSIPTVISPIRYEGRLLVDGGVVRNLPVQEAKILGADYTIGINVGEGFSKLDETKLNLIDITGNVASMGGRREVERQKRMLDLYIEPDVAKIASTDFTKVKEIIALGEAAARQNIEEIRKLSDPVKFEEIQAKKREFKKTWKDTYSIKNIQVKGNKKYDNDYFKRFIPKNLDAMKKDDFENVVDKIYSSGDFLTVYYEINGEDLTLVVQEKAGQYLTMDGNMNTEDYVSATLGFQGNKVINNTTLRYSLSGVANQEYGLKGQIVGSRGLDSKLIFLTRFNLRNDIIKNQYYNGKKFDFDNKISTINTGIGAEFGKNFILLAGIGYEKSATSKNMDEMLNKKSEYPIYNLQLTYDSRNSFIFPTRGYHFKALYTHGDSPKVNFDALEFEGEAVFSISKNISIIPNIQYLSSSGTNIPETYIPKMGGYSTRNFSLAFRGLDKDSVKGNSILTSNIKFQYRLNKFIYIDAGISRAFISDSEFSVNSDTTKQSYDFGIGIKTPIGPTYIGGSKAEGESIKYYLNLGYEIND